MPYSDPEYHKKYYQNNKDKWINKLTDEQKQKKYEKNKEFRENHKEEYKEKRKVYDKKYNQTDKGKKANKMRRWRAMGITDPNLDEWYDKWNNATNCVDCDCVLGRGQYGGNKRCLDHDHKTGLVRDVVCSACNNKRK